MVFWERSLLAFPVFDWEYWEFSYLMEINQLISYKSVIKHLSVDFPGLFANSKSDKGPVRSFLAVGGTEVD